jgi:dTDP-4-dehydrorhamnose reductase
VVWREVIGLTIWEFNLERDKKILVTGAKGQLGKELVALLYAKGHHVLAVDLPGFDLTDARMVKDYLIGERPEFVFHCAAYTDVEGAEDEPEYAMEINSRATARLASCVQKLSATLVYFSTDFVFDGRRKRPYTEDMTPHPLCSYARSKLAGEIEVTKNCQRHFIIRTAWLFGDSPNAFPLKILAQAKAGTPLSVVNDQRGSPTYAQDLAVELLLLLESSDYGLYHLTNSGTATWYELAKETLDLAGFSDYPIKPVTSKEFPAKAKRPVYSVLDCRKYATNFGVKLRHWRKALAEYVNHYYPANS